MNPVRHRATGPVRYRYTVRYFSESGRALGQVPVEPDWEPVYAWAHFQGMRSGELPAVTVAPPGAIEPVWDPVLGAPVISAVRVVLTGEEADRPVCAEIPRTYFDPLARAHAAQVSHGAEPASDGPNCFHVCAHPIAPSSEPQCLSGASADSELQVEPVPQPLSLGVLPMVDLLARSEGVGEHHQADAPVFVHRRILDQVTELAHAAGDQEVGGILIGALHRDPDGGELFLEVVAQVPAKHADAGGTHFEFSPETWAAADAALALRASGEFIAGPWHSHPDWCRSCPEERRRRCLFSLPFYSEQDRHLHRTCFPAAYQVGLLISALPDRGLTPTLFGWRHGMVVARGFQILGG